MSREVIQATVSHELLEDGLDTVVTETARTAERFAFRVSIDDRMVVVALGSADPDRRFRPFVARVMAPVAARHLAELLLSNSRSAEEGA